MYTASVGSMSPMETPSSPMPGNSIDFIVDCTELTAIIPKIASKPASTMDKRRPMR